MKYLSLLFCLPLMGCAGVSSVVSQLKNDPAHWKVTVVNPAYGSLIIEREFPTNWVPPTTVIIYTNGLPTLPVATPATK